MRKHQIQPLLRWIVVAICVVVSTDSASASTSLRSCVARDMQILMFLEEREGANAISTRDVAEAMLTMMHARIVCFEGHVPEALALYDSIIQRIADASAAANASRRRGLPMDIPSDVR